MAQSLDQQTFQKLVPLACEWAGVQEQLVLLHGTPLTSDQTADAQRAGVEHYSRVRVLVAERIPLPENPELADAAQRTQILTEDSHGLAIGHAIVIRADRWGDRELLVHNLVHVAQCERAGGLEPWVRHYLGDRRASPIFTIGACEEEARALARKICAQESTLVEYGT